jgi:membrane associated rhomboid family serine protease
MRGSQEPREHGPVWRYFFDPLYVPRPLFAVPCVVGAVFAIVLGVLAGWTGAVAGLLIGLSYAGVFWARARLVRWLTRKRVKGR